MGLVHVYNLPSVEFRASLFPYQGPNNPVRSICFVPRTTNLLISYTGSKLAEYSLEGLQLRSISTLELRYTRTVVCDGAIIAVSSFDNQTDLFSKLAVQV